LPSDFAYGSFKTAYNKANGEIRKMSETILALQSPNPALKIRPVRLEDSLALRADCWVHRSQTGANERIKRILSIMEQRRGLGVVVEEDKLILAYGQIVHWRETAEISDLIVSEQQRSKGIGTAMIQFLLRGIHSAPLEAVEIGAAISNPRALALYRRLGFVDSHKRILNVGSGSEEIIYLRLKLKD
jgi:ribosomal protein S18 acetylase RimI-like enzyme